MSDLLGQVRSEHLIILESLDLLRRGGLGDLESRADVVAELLLMLRTHAELESELLYPLLGASGLADHSELERREAQEHQAIDRLALTLQSVEDNPSLFVDALARLAALVATHVDDEELRVFFTLRTTTAAAELKRLGGLWRGRRQTGGGRLPRRPETAGRPADAADHPGR